MNLLFTRIAFGAFLLAGVISYAPIPHGGGPIPPCFGPTPPQPPGPGVGSKGGPQSPGPAGGRPAGPSSPGPSAPAPVNPGPSTPTPRGGVGTPDFGVDLTSWIHWWTFNRARYLQLKTHVHSPKYVLTVDPSDGLGGKAGQLLDSLRPTDHEVLTTALPALRGALEKSTNRDLQSGVLMALAKIGLEPKKAITCFRSYLTSKDQELSETAALALGILAEPMGVSILFDVFEDNAAGRRWTDSPTEVPWRTRAFACYGLGLTAARTPDPALRRQVQEVLIKVLTGPDRRIAQDIQVAAVTSLGLFPDPDRRSVAALEAYFERNRLTASTVCAHVPNAVARLLRDGSLDERAAYCAKLLDELAGNPNRKDKEIRASFAQAIGLLTHAEDPHAKRAIEVLRSKVDDEFSKNPILAYFGMIALGQISGSGKSGLAVDAYLLDKALTKGGNTMTRSWAALSLGVSAFERRRRGAALDDSVGDQLLTRLGELRDMQARAAFAIGLGLIGHAPAASEMKRCLDDVKDGDWKSYFATGLGLLGDQSAIPLIRDVVKASTNRPALLAEAAIALALLGEKETLPELLAMLRDPKNKVYAVQSTLAVTIGYIGDSRAVKPLAAMLTDESQGLTEGSRAFAASALGLVCDKEDLPWNFKVSTDVNYTALVSTLNDPASQTGILNLL